MTMLDSQRLASHAVLKTLEGRNLTQTLNETWRAHPGLASRQKGLIQDSSYGVFRYYGTLHALLQLLLRKPLKDRNLEALLLVSLYQLMHTQAPHHAVVNHAVEASRKFEKGLVNAVLRNFLRQKESLLERVSLEESAVYNHPKWWIEKLKAEYPDRFREILDAGNSKPPMTLRVNLRKTTLSGYLALLQQADIECRTLSEVGLMLARPLPVESLPGFSEGLVSVQDLGAQKAASLLDLKDGMRVLDACAAPGGKSAHILESAEVELLSLDNNPARSKQIRENFTRLGLSGKIATADAADPDSWWDGIPFERILADVPCSASGVVRRHPDIKWLRRPGDLAGFARQQSAILEALWQTLASGGKLLYSTCSVFEEENARVVGNFVDMHEDAVFCASNESVPDGQLLPNDLHDGFFYALLRKK